MSNMLYPLEKIIQDHLSYSDDRKKDDLSINELRTAKTFLIKAWPDTHEQAKQAISKILGGTSTPDMGSFATSEEIHCVCVSSGQYMILSDKAGLAIDIAVDVAAVTDISHSRCGLKIKGSKATSLLNKGLSFPLDDDHFPIGGVFQGSIHSIGVIILKTGNDEFALFCYTSFAVSFFEWVIDSAIEYGYALSDKAQSLN